jgi:hypothetical protein
MTARTKVELVPAAGSIRRVQALAVAGWPLRRTGREAGLKPIEIVRLMKADLVPADTARTIADVYARYSTASPGLCGVSAMHARAARASAYASGWAPAAAWDDDTIDDPAAHPEWTGHCGTVRGASLHEKHAIPLCPPCKAALHRRRLRAEARTRRASTTRA